MNIIFAGYREWADAVIEDIQNIKRYAKHKFLHVRTPDALEACLKLGKFDVIILLGWSWKIPDHILDTCYVIGIHPSDLPDFAGGTPIQHQIIAGVLETNATLFRITPTLDAGPIIDKARFSLAGNIEDVFSSLSGAAAKLIKHFLLAWPNIQEQPQPAHSNVYRRLKPVDGCLNAEKIAQMNTKTLYDFIRCRTDPYPNAYIEDETGTIYFSSVKFVPK